MDDGNLVGASSLVMVALAHIRQLYARIRLKSMFAAVFCGEAGIDILERDADRSDSLQSNHDSPRMISGIVAPHDTVNPVIDVGAIGVTITGSKILAFKTEVVTCPPHLPEKNKPQIKSAVRCNDATTVGNRQFRLMSNVITWRARGIVTRAFEVKQKLACEARLVDTGLPYSGNCRGQCPLQCLKHDTNYLRSGTIESIRKSVYSFLQMSAENAHVLAISPSGKVGAIRSATIRSASD